MQFIVLGIPSSTIVIKPSLPSHTQRMAYTSCAVLLWYGMRWNGSDQGPTIITLLGSRRECSDRAWAVTAPPHPPYCRRVTKMAYTSCAVLLWYGMVWSGSDQGPTIIMLLGSRRECSDRAWAVAAPSSFHWILFWYYPIQSSWYSFIDGSNHIIVTVART